MFQWGPLFRLTQGRGGGRNVSMGATVKADPGKGVGGRNVSMGAAV